MTKKLPGTPASDPINVRARELYEKSLIQSDGSRKPKPSWPNASWADRATFKARAEMEAVHE